MTAFNDTERQTLYSVALSCCGNKHRTQSTIGKQSAAPSKQHMNLIITLAMEHSAYFRNYAGWVVGMK